MFTTSLERSTCAGSGPIRSAFAQSTATSTRSSMSPGSSRRTPSSCRKAYSRGSGPPPDRYISTSLPSWRSATVVASSEPSASPSGFSWVTTRNRSCARRASTTECRSVICGIVVGGELIDQLCHANATLDRRIVLERQLWSPLHSELAGKPALKQPMSSLEPGERRTLLARVAEHADVDRRHAEVGARHDSGDRDEADPRVLQLGQRLRHDLPDGLVHSTHPVTHRGYSSECTGWRCWGSVPGASSSPWREGFSGSSSGTSGCRSCSLCRGIRLLPRAPISPSPGWRAPPRRSPTSVPGRRIRR